MQLDQTWPLFALRLLTPRLELRPVRDDDLPGLVDAALAGIHDSDRMPFGVPWTDAPPRELARSLAQYHWRLRADAHPNRWAISFAVLRESTPIGIQEMHTRNFLTLRTIESASWLTRGHQGQGLGTEMRAALLLFAFDHLGADWAESGAADWNLASLRISERLGYHPNGLARRETRRGEIITEQHMRVGPADFRRPDWTLEVQKSESMDFLLAKHSD